MYLLLLLACRSEAPHPPVPETPPPGRIGGTPILDRTIVLGGLATEAVEAELERVRPQVEACRATEAVRGAGKVLVRFVVRGDGTVGEARLVSTSLRDEAVEGCLLGVVKGATFPPLSVGDQAIVTYTFSYSAG